MQSEYSIVLYNFLAGPGGKAIPIGGSTSSTTLQKQSIDMVIGNNEWSKTIEEKLVRWPKKNKPLTNFTLETHSNSTDDGYAFGWMMTAQCDYLLYAFEIQERGVTSHFDAYLINFPKLHRWFWRTLAEGKHAFGSFTTEYRNQSMTCLVPIETVCKQVGFHRYIVTKENAKRMPYPLSSARIRPIRSQMGGAS